MKQNRVPFILVMVVVPLILVAGIGLAQKSEPLQLAAGSQPQATMLSAFTYQGQLLRANNPINATCQMQFDLYGSASGGSTVAGPITQSAQVVDGLFTVQLDFGADVFNGAGRWLGIQVQCPGDPVFVDMGRQELTPVPYALHTSGSPYQNVIAVARLGGDFTSVQAALDSITDATADNPYLVWVAPGVYDEKVTMKPYVHLQGAGQEATILTSSLGDDTWVPSIGTVILSSYSTVSDMTVRNTGNSIFNIALLAGDGIVGAVVKDATFEAVANAGSLPGYYGMLITGSSTNITLENITARAENGGTNFGAMIFLATAQLKGGSYTADGGSRAYGIYAPGANLVADEVNLLAENSIEYNQGLYLEQGAEATLNGGSFTATGGSNNYAIHVASSTLTANQVDALAENGDASNQALHNNISATTLLNGGTFTARGESSAVGLANQFGGANLEANNVTVLAENANQNYALLNTDGAHAKLYGGSYTASGGSFAYGILTVSSTSTLEAQGLHITATLASTARGVESNSGSAATVTQSVIQGTHGTVISLGGGGTITLTHSSVEVGPIVGNVLCAAVSRNMLFLINGCP